MTPRRAVLIAGVLLLCFALLTVGLVIAEKYFFPSETVEGGTSILIDGEEYRAKDLTTFLVFAVDKHGEFEAADSYNNDQQADFLMLIAFDEKTRTFSVLPINRDTMVDIDVLGVTGDWTGRRINAQLALAHTYGDGLDRSNNNTRKAVSRFLYNTPIDYYAAMTMDSLIILNDYIGGVEVTMDEDHTAIDPTYVKGATVRLEGEAALRFVQARMTADDGTNVSRMARQKLYMESFLTQLQNSNPTEEFLKGAYDALLGITGEETRDDHFAIEDETTDASGEGEKSNGAYLQSNATTYQLERMMKLFVSYSMSGVYSVPGTVDYSGKYAKFHADDDGVKALVKELYLDKVN